MIDFPLTVERIQHPLDAAYFISGNVIYYRPLTTRAERAFFHCYHSLVYPGCYGFVKQPDELISDNNLLVAPEDTMI